MHCLSAILCPSYEMSGFILFSTFADETAKGNKSCRNLASNWMSMRAGENTWPWRTMKCLNTIPVCWKIRNVWNGQSKRWLQSCEALSFQTQPQKFRLHFSSILAETGRLPIPFGTTSRSASINLTTWWRKLVKQLSCREFIPTTRSVSQQSPSGRMLEFLTAISRRFLAIAMSRVWLISTHSLQLLSFYTAAKSFPAIFKGPQH